MKFIVMLFLTVSAAFASQKSPIEDRIAQKLDLLFSDTVNEGDQSATVIQTKCQSQTTRLQSIDQINCQVNIELQMIYAEPVQTCRKSCEVSYLMKEKDIESLEVVEDSLTACFEDLNQGC